MKRFWTITTAGALLASLLTVTAPALGAPITAQAPASPSVLAAATKAKPPKITLGKKKTTTTKAPNKSSQKVVLPILGGSTAKNRKLFATYAAAVVKAEQKSFNVNRKGGCGSSKTA
ncbi:hypothetical protein [Paeniglutamicibacter cryotolerans]|uniref:Uncharacterized protein n=1 Tax=Paeniglutamicibacter cryotolerans TaxID=670079 RepID=A0A839QQW7_9MICC|nr:hypothetical protein [Paeniglutamicibacter cryotolerans]MBB2997174.1 hypothetical protein [Paeniglutamicibacter cryotolerans]